MRKQRWFPVVWTLGVFLLLSGLLVMPVRAAQRTVSRSADQTATTNIDAKIYLATATLQPMFQDRINQQVPAAVSSAINGIVGTLPKANQGWASLMATTLIQPSAKLQSLAPQQGGLATNLQVSLYPGDPKPFDVNMLVKFKAADASTIQVSAQPLNGSPALVNGPLTTFHMPIGQLKSVQATPSCGDAALSVGLNFPISLGLGATPTPTTTTQGQQSASGLSAKSNLQAQSNTAANGSGTSSFVEIPASSLAQLGNSVSSLPLNNSLSVQNIQVAVQGNQLVVTSDVMLNGALQMGTATTYIQPTAQNGSLAVHVVQTTLDVLIFHFQYDTYNQQIEQMLNSKLNGALTGKFTVTDAAIGANSHIPCAASDSLIMTGTTSLI